jgi:hypothetical protein
MNKNRKDQERSRSSESSSGSKSVLGSKESFEHGSGTSEMARGMGSSGERGMGSESHNQQGSGISNRGTSRERDEQSRVPERGRGHSGE